MAGYLVDFLSASQLLKRYDVAVVRSEYVSSPEDGLAFYHGEITQQHPAPLTLKVISPKVPEKNASGLVLNGLNSDEEVRKGFLRLADAAKPFVPFRILAQPTVRGRRMGLAVGSRTRQDGQQWLFLGLLPGGAQVISERVERPVPVDADGAAAMIAQLHSARALAPRGRDLAMLKHFLANVSRLVEQNKIVELMLSPVILHENQYTAVDVKMFTERAKLAPQHQQAKKSAGGRNLMSLERRESVRRVKSVPAAPRIAPRTRRSR